LSDRQRNFLQNRSKSPFPSSWCRSLRLVLLPHPFLLAVSVCLLMPSASALCNEKCMHLLTESVDDFIETAIETALSRGCSQGNLQCCKESVKTLVAYRCPAWHESLESQHKFRAPASSQQWQCKMPRRPSGRTPKVTFVSHSWRRWNQVKPKFCLYMRSGLLDLHRAVRWQVSMLSGTHVDEVKTVIGKTRDHKQLQFT